MDHELRPAYWILNSNLSLRSAQLTDSESVARLILEICTIDGDATNAMTSEELRNHWKTHLGSNDR